MFNQTNLFFIFVIVAVLIVSVSWMFFGDMPMFKKRYLPILALALLLFTVGATVILRPIVDIKNAQPQMIEVCRNALAPADYMVHYDCEGNKFYRTLSYQSIKFFPLFPETVTVYFDDGIDGLWCNMQRNGSKWVVIRSWSTQVSMCPN